MIDIFAHEHPDARSKLPGIFLAGPSHRKPEDKSWRSEALIYLKSRFEGRVYVPLPRSADWHLDYIEQIEWELTYLEAATAIAFWIPRSESLPGFKTNMEFGLFAKSGKVVLGYPHSAPHTRYLDHLAHLAHKFHIPVAHTLPHTLDVAMEMVIAKTA